MFSAATVVAKAGAIRGGKGEDTIASERRSALGFTVAIGAGNDVLNVGVSGKFEKGLIASDKDNTVGNDTINIGGSAMSGSTIIGGGGNGYRLHLDGSGHRQSDSGRKRKRFHRVPPACQLKGFHLQGWSRQRFHLYR